MEDGVSAKFTEIDLYKNFISGAIDAYYRGDDTDLLIIVECLLDSARAKNILREKGYGWTGLNIVETAKLVPANSEE